MGAYKMRKLILALMFLVVAAISANLGCPAACLAKGVDIRIADSKGDWGYPNPYRHYPRGPGYVRMSWVFDTLLWKDNGGYVPALASKWSYDQDKMRFSFELNPKAKWHDGQPLTADDVVFTVEYFKKHPYRWVTVSYIKQAWAKGPHRVEIQLTKPYAPFISDIAGTMPIVPRHIWQGVSDPKKFNDPKAFIGSGPYRFRDFNKAKGSYLFEAFADYYQGRPKADRLIYVKSGKPLISLLTGQVDLANIQPEMAKPLKKKGLKVIRNERGWNKKLMINHTKEPFSHRAFRQALAYAIDRQEIIDKAHRGLATPASYGQLTVDHAMYNPNIPDYPYNPAKARELIESLGYAKGPGGFYQKDGKTLAIELCASNVTVAGERVADRDGEIIKKHLLAVGIKTELVNQEQTTADSRVKNWDFDLAVSGHGGLAGDPRILAEMIMSKYGAGSVNSAKYDACPELNQALEAQLVEMDPAKRKELVFKVQELFARELPAMPLYYPDSMAAYNPAKGVNWYYTKGGLCKGIPIPQNKMSLIK
jgi:peptide/nickel transport system substrate-binding protein